MGSCLSADGRSGGSSLSADGRSGSSSPLSPGSPASGARRHRGRSKRRPRASADEEDELHRIPGRVFLNGATSSASLFSQQGKKGPNQDAMIVWENFSDNSDTIFCGVFDGHGPHGHMVARKVRDILPLKLCSSWRANIGNDEHKENNINTMNSKEIPNVRLIEEPRVSIDLEERYKQLELFKTLKDTFLKASRIVDKELRLHPEIDCFSSGTTAVTLVKQGQHLIIGNVGDSRAILGTRDKNDSLIAVQLTVDLKPSLPREAERIRRCKGRVFALRDEPEVARVWMPNTDSPGLAMARAFGDFCLKDFGLISVPEVSYRSITEKDEFVVLATDGVWDVLSNKEVVNVVASAPTRSAAARSLVEAAVKAWKSKYPTSKIDDCAVVCFFLNIDSPYNSTASTKEANGPLHGNQVVSDAQESAMYLDKSGTVRSSTEIGQGKGKEAPNNHV